MDDLKLYGSNEYEIDSLVKVVKILSGDTEMQFGFDKCAMLKVKRGKQVHCEWIDLWDDVVIEEPDEEEYKYLGILERDNVCQEKMKERWKRNNINETGSAKISRMVEMS